MLTAASTDGQIVAACRAGDQDAWRALIARFDRYILGIIRHGYRVPEQDAEDVFQEIFVKAYRRLDDLRSDDAIGPWLAGIARHTCLSRMRTRIAEPAEHVDHPSDADAGMDLVERAMDVDAALQQLPEACREILERFFRLEQPYSQIAQELSLPPGTVASRISRCLSRLRAELEGRDQPVGASGQTS